MSLTRNPLNMPNAVYLLLFALGCFALAWYLWNISRTRALYGRSMQRAIAIVLVVVGAFALFGTVYLLIAR